MTRVTLVGTPPPMPWLLLPLISFLRCVDLATAASASLVLWLQFHRAFTVLWLHPHCACTVLCHCALTVLSL